jgi:hypothetical protein
LTRRRLLEGGALAVGSGALALLPLDRLGVVPKSRLSDLPREPAVMHKCISFGGPGPLRQEGHPDDYRLWGNREYIRESGTAWVKLWISWSELQADLGAPPADLSASWEHLNQAPRGEGWLRRLDAQVRAANNDGRRVLLTLVHAFPPWSSGASGPDPVTQEKPPEQKIPADLSPESPWAWFIAHLCARYRKGAPKRPQGPALAAGAKLENAVAGNPAGGWIDALEICNEPNLMYWPVEAVVGAVARMMETADSVAHRLGGPAIVAPATSDFPDTDQADERGIHSLEWKGFTRGLLRELRGFRARGRVHWSQHNFRDVKLGERQSRAATVAELLATDGWFEHGQPLWLTEGGYNLGRSPSDPSERQLQAGLIQRSFERMKRDGRIYMWTQHTISDKADNDFRSGLRDDFVPARGPGAPRPAWRVWRDLSGS